MNPPTVIIKKTGHVAKVAQAGDLLYLDQTSGAAYYESRAAALLDRLITVALGPQADVTAEEKKSVIGKKRRRKRR